MKPETRSFYAEAVPRAIEHIAVNLDEVLDLKTLASGACLSPFHFHRVFRGMVGETPLDVIRRLRVELAAWRLTHSRSAITEIAFDAGYETQEAFTRAFRGCYSKSPLRLPSEETPRTELAATCGVHFNAGRLVPAFIPRDSGGQTMDVEIKEMPELRVGTVRHVGPYNQIPQAFERLGSIGGPAGLFRQPGAAMIAIYHDDPDHSADQLRSDAAIVVPEHETLPKGLVEQRIPAGRYACAAHVGPYEQLGDAWARFMGEWLPASGHRVRAGPSYEIYRNDPTKVPKQELASGPQRPGRCGGPGRAASRAREPPSMTSRLRGLRASRPGRPARPAKRPPSPRPHDGPGRRGLRRRSPSSGPGGPTARR